MTPAAIIIVLWLIGCAFIAWHLWYAPEGYQDSFGFHHGRPSSTDDFEHELNARLEARRLLRPIRSAAAHKGWQTRRHAR